MKYFLIFLTIFVVKVESYSRVVTYVDWLMAQWGSEKIAAALGVPGYEEYPTPYTIVNLAFVVSYGYADAVAIWMNPRQYMNRNDEVFGTTNDDIQKAWKKLYNDAGKKVILAAFGDSWMPTRSDPVATCARLAQIVKDNNFDGIDLDFEDNDAMNKGTGEQWVIECTRTIRTILPYGEYILTHAPQAPYFTGFINYTNGAYYTINKEVGDLIDWYNIQFYNQGDTKYQTYEVLFVEANEGEWRNSAVKQIHENCQIPYDKLVVGKPVLPKDVANTGYVPADQLHDWGIKAQNELGWNAGFMAWQYLSDEKDLHGEFMNTVVATDIKKKIDE